MKLAIEPMHVFLKYFFVKNNRMTSIDSGVILVNHWGFSSDST